MKPIYRDTSGMVNDVFVARIGHVFAQQKEHVMNAQQTTTLIDITQFVMFAQLVVLNAAN
jgi:hypothetical protein